MVLIRRCGVAGLLLLVGCAQSLFDSRMVDVDDATCGARCVADAAADFDGTASGTNRSWHWRYLDDHRDRSWTAMNPSANRELTSADTSNRITTCAAHPGEPACQALPRALLVSTTGGDSQTDPAIELTAPTSTVIQLSVHAFVPGGDAQTIRLYRNSREDVLFTATATAGVGLQHTITLDTVAGDRFLVAIEPTGKGGAGVGLHLFASTTGADFPSSCQLYVPFTSVNAKASDTDDLCGPSTFTFFHYPTLLVPEPTTIQPDTQAPFPELAPAAALPKDTFFKGDQVLDWSGDVTVQLWVKLSTGAPSVTAWLFSDLDPMSCGGIGIAIVPAGGGANLDVTACAGPGTVKFDHAATMYPIDDRWRFVRVVRTSDRVLVCVDGVGTTSFPVNADRPTGFTTPNPPYLGKDYVPLSNAYFDGEIDDVRVITGALPCDITAAP